MTLPFFSLAHINGDGKCSMFSPVGFITISSNERDHAARFKVVSFFGFAVSGPDGSLCPADRRMPHPAAQESTDGLEWLKGLVTSTESSTVTMRNNLHIATTPASQVTLVTDNSICTAVAQARAADMQLPYDNEPIYVYKVGSLYTAEEHVGSGFQDQTSWRAIHFFDLGFNYVSLAGR